MVRTGEPNSPPASAPVRNGSDTGYTGAASPNRRDAEKKANTPAAAESQARARPAKAYRSPPSRSAFRMNGHAVQPRAQMSQPASSAAPISGKQRRRREGSNSGRTPQIQSAGYSASPASSHSASHTPPAAEAARPCDTRALPVSRNSPISAPAASAPSASAHRNGLRRKKTIFDDAQPVFVSTADSMELARNEKAAFALFALVSARLSRDGEAALASVAAAPSFVSVIDSEEALECLREDGRSAISAAQASVSASPSAKLPAFADRIAGAFSRENSAEKPTVPPISSTREASAAKSARLLFRF